MKHVSIYECQLENVMYIRPVIFIPGIMGSKLQNAVTKKRVWDPDDQVSFGGVHALRSPASKRAVLIGPPARNHFNPNFLEIFYDPDEDAVKQTESMRYEFWSLWTDIDAERIKKWSGLAQDFYGYYLKGLECGHHIEGNTYYYNRVYAHPYNWTASNQTSAEKLAETVDFAIRNTQEWIDHWVHGVTYEGTYIPTLKPLKPIIVTHSMGGLVSRGYTQSDNRANADKIAGVLHIAMPTDGSPNTYANMLAGSDASDVMLRKVLGANQEQVTATGGNMPGALELLPNHKYKNGNGQKATSTENSLGWMQIYGRDGKIASSMPNPMAPYSYFNTPKGGGIPDGDPYNQIYINQKDWWRLIYKEYLNPRGGDDDAAFMECRRSILKAKAFHIQINKHKKFHPNTRMLYSDGAAKEFQACDIVRWNLTRGMFPIPENAKVESSGKGKIEFITMELAPSTSSTSGMKMYPITHATYEMERMKAPGDATVHRGAAAYEKGPQTEAAKRPFNHTKSFDYGVVVKWIREQLRTMAEEDIACMSAS